MSYFKFLVPFLLLSACGGTDTKSPGDLPDGAPTVSSTVPKHDGTGVAINLPITATFSKAMDPSTLDASTFFLMEGTTVVSGTVTYAGTTATLTPASDLPSGTKLTATITTGAMDEAGVALEADTSWTFTTVANDGPPAVSATIPLDGAVDVWIGERIHATFNMPMDATTLTPDSFTMREGSNLVTGEVAYDGATNSVVFTPTLPLGGSATYTMTLSTDVKSAMERELEADHVWSFTTAVVSKPAAVNLGSAGNYAILAQTQISTVPLSAITGDIAVSPAAATFITGFSLVADATETFATSTQVVGEVFAADQADPTPANLTTAIADMGTAFTEAAGRAPDVTELGAGDIGGMTLPAGVYKWGSGLLIPTDVTLAGNATDVWIFQIAQNLTLSSATNIFLTGGALSKNIFWQVSGLVDLDTTSHLEGIVLSQTAITLRTGATVNGRLLAQSAVDIDGSTVVEPAP